MDKNTKVIVESIPPQGASYGPYYNACEGRTFTTGGHVFHIFLYEGYNAMGLIGTERNGIGMVSVTDRQVVFDNWLCKGMGFAYRDSKMSELLHIIAMDAEELQEFLAGMNNNGRHCRYNPLEDAKMKKPREAKKKKLDAGIAKKKVSDFESVQFMDAKEKAGVARDFELFVVARLMMDAEQAQQTEYGALFKPFTKRLYNHYNQNLGHIAHSNIAGFFAAQFEDTRDFVENLRRAAEGISLFGYSILHNDYGDLNQVMQAVARHYLPLAEALLAKENQAAEDAEVERAKALLTRKGILQPA